MRSTSFHTCVTRELLLYLHIECTKFMFLDMLLLLCTWKACEVMDMMALRFVFNISQEARSCPRANGYPLAFSAFATYEKANFFFLLV